VLEAPHHGGRQQHQRLAAGLGLHVGGDRHLADVELELAHHWLEEPVRRPDVAEVEGDAVRLDLAAHERKRVRIVVEGRAQGSELSIDAHLMSFLLRVGRADAGQHPF